MGMSCTYVKRQGNTVSFADNSEDGTRVGAINHGMSDGDSVRISFSTSYNGTFEIFNVTANTYDIRRTFVEDDGAVIWKNIVSTNTTMRYFLVNCPKLNQLCSASSGAWVAASTVCNQRLF